MGAPTTWQAASEEYLVQWKGYDISQMTWVARSQLLADVPALLHVYKTSPTTDQARKSVPKRAPTTVTLPIARHHSTRGASSELAGTARWVLMRHFMIRFAGFVKSFRSNRVVKEERLLGSFSVYVACVHVILL